MTAITSPRPRRALIRPAPSSRTVLIYLAALSLVACSSGSGEGGSAATVPEESALRPTFTPTSTLTATTGGDEPGVTSTVELGGSTSSPAQPGAVEVTMTEASITDPAFDTSKPLLEAPPAWADLLGARLIRSRSGFELRVRLGGGDAPESIDADRTMNLASFYDVDGDGAIDFEIWANLASGGWGSSYFDNDRGTGSFQEESFVTVTTDGDEVVLRFALLHLDRSSRFQWSLASEWGSYEAIGSTSMVRDSAPDGGAAASFPDP